MKTVKTGASPDLLSEIYNFADEYFSEEPVQPTPSNTNLEPLRLPSLTVDKHLLISQQLADPSLKTVHQLADKQERGYAYLDGVLINLEQTELDNPIRQVVLPTLRRLSSIQLAHDSDLGGHCGVKRTLSKLRLCDLVGPYPRTSRGFKYLLTCVCYFSRYPEGIPLKKLDECSVANATVEVFSHTGLPEEILTDQGSVFVGKLMKQLCKILRVLAHSPRRRPRIN